MHFTIQSQSIKLLSGALIFLAIALTLASSCTGSSRHFKGKSGDTAAKTQQEAPFYFDDYQDVQLAAAQKWGITPIASRDTDFTKIPQLEKIESCDLYTVEYLSHSVPYLTHHAKALLDTIAKAFQDSLAARHVRIEKIIVTSVTRTMDDVKRLQRVNSNAVSQSSHCYGTTFDIAHNNFYAVNKEGEELPYSEQKLILGHVLYRLRMRHMCWVLVEERQPCFHVTVNY